MIFIGDNAMVASLNLHRLFSTDAGYLLQLKVRDRDEADLRAAREIIRAILRAAFANWERFVTRYELFGGASLPTDFRMPAPKFRIQGSFAYHTANDCQQNPPQQVDQDDGVYLPLGFVTNGGKSHPGLASSAYFAIVERALAPLCKERGWTLNPKRLKNTCVRVEIDKRLHIDLPLYSMSNESFAALVESRAKAVLRAAASATDPDILDEDVYQNMPSSAILLAHRREGWVESDPRTLERWFQTAIGVYGPQLRRLCRCYKGFRDARWSACDLGSICLMAATVSAMGQLGPLDDKRDDIALLRVGEKLVDVLAKPIENPAFPGDEEKYLCKDWTPEFREEVRAAFADMCRRLRSAIFETLHKGIALKAVRASFGERVPDDESLIALVGLAAEIRRAPSQPQPKPMVPRTTSG